MSREAEYRYCPDAFPGMASKMHNGPPVGPYGGGDATGLQPMPPWKRRDWDRHGPEWEARRQVVHQEVLERAKGIPFASLGIELMQLLIAEAVEDITPTRVSDDAHCAYRDARGHSDGPAHYHWSNEFSELLNRYRKILGSRTEGIHRFRTHSYFWRSDADAARNPE